ncbi:unnamed protein product [Microthlaspi erraticum]|uniref:F-box domain-containing protein n=1 Tax=Microthlaspi erraticum TaxID=1685480 RepID=A0A6D2J2M1_9BRAS|nr:unnamed protein product [Microthlaspi erraticum]
MEREKRRCGNINQEIVEEILVKLPVKSLVRFKAVSREWRGAIESTFFIEKQIRYQKYLEGQQARIVTLSREKRYNGVALGNLLISANGIVHDSSYLPIRALNLFDGFKISEPCDGLFCVYTITRIFNLVNPATTSRRRLPDPTSTVSNGRDMNYTLLGMGRENSLSRRYKLVWFFECDMKQVKKSTRCKVFAFDSNTWRYVDPPHCRVEYGHPLIHLEGVMYCFTAPCMEEQGPFEKEVLAFDLHTETSQSFSVTPDIGESPLSMRVLNHRLCIFKRHVYTDDLVFKIWGLDINKRSWEIMYSIDLSCFPPEFQGSCILPVAKIDNYLIISNVTRTTCVLYGSKNRILHGTSGSPAFNTMSYFETLVSPYQ